MHRKRGDPLIQRTGSKTLRSSLVGAAALAAMAAGCNSADTSTTSASADPTTAATGDASIPATDETTSAATGTLKVGSLQPLTGFLAQGGMDANDGFSLYVDSKGGALAGWEIELIEEDTEQNLDAAAGKIRKLVEQDGVRFMFGLGDSSVAYGLRDYIDSAGVPFVITQAGADGLTQAVASESIYRVTYTGSQNTMPLGEYTCNELGYQTAVIMAFDFAFGWESTGGFARTYEDAGCDVVQEIYTPITTQDYAPFIQQVDQSADVLMFVNAPASAISIWRAIDGFALDMPVVGHGAITDEQFLDQAAGTSDEAVTALHYAKSIDSPENTEFVEAFRAATGREPGFNAEAGYAAAQVLEAALEEAGDQGDDPAALAEAIAGVRVDAPRGPLSFDEYGQGVFNVYIRVTDVVDGERQNTIIHTYDDVSQFWTYDPEEYLALEPYTELVGTWSE